MPLTNYTTEVTDWLLGAPVEVHIKVLAMFGLIFLLQTVAGSSISLIKGFAYLIGLAKWSIERWKK